MRHPDAGAQGSTRMKDEILKVIAGKMAAGTWRPYQSVRELALQFDMPLHNATKYVADASRLIRIGWFDEEAKAMLLERISQIGRASEFRHEDTALPDGTVVSLSKPDYRTALKSAEDLATIVGLMGTNADVVIKFQQMSDSELWAEAERFAQQLTHPKEIIHVTTTGESLEPSRDTDTNDPESEALALDRLITSPTR